MPPWKVLPNQRGEGGRSEEGEAGGEVGEGSFGWVRGGIRACLSYIQKFNFSIIL